MVANYLRKYRQIYTISAFEWPMCGKLQVNHDQSPSKCKFLRRLFLVPKLSYQSVFTAALNST